MNHRARVRLAINHEEPDRVPIDLWGSASRISNELYFKIVKYLNYKECGELEKASRCSDYVDYRISDLINADFRHINARPPKNYTNYINKNGHVINEWGLGSIYSESGNYPTVVYHPLADAELSDVDKYKWPIAEDTGRIEGIEERAKNWFENTDYSITATPVVSGLALDICQSLRGFEQFFIDLYCNKKFAEKLIWKVTEIITQMSAYYIKPIGSYIDWFEFTSDHGMQDRSLLSRKLYREFFFKPNKILIEEVKKVAPNAKCYLHSCGSVRELIPEFIEMGVDILNSLQPRAKGMDSFELKKEFGNDLVFHGGVDMQGGINGSIDDAIKEVKTRIMAFAKGGGYIFGPSNHFLVDTPVENFFVIYKTALEYGRYPIEINIY